MVETVNQTSMEEYNIPIGTFEAITGLKIPKKKEVQQ